MLVLIGVRVAFATAFIGFLGLCLFFMQKQGFDRGLVTAMKLAGQVPHSKSTTYALSPDPDLHSDRLPRLLRRPDHGTCSRPPNAGSAGCRAGLAVATVFATAGFAAVSGASVATSAVFARIAIPEMLKVGYDKRFAAGVVAAGGTLASLIPPSAILVIYAIIVEAIGGQAPAGRLPARCRFGADLRRAGRRAGAVRNPNLGPPVGGFTWGQRFAALPGTLPILLVVFIIVYLDLFRLGARRPRPARWAPSSFSSWRSGGHEVEPAATAL